MRGREVFVVDAVRTPVGKFGGTLAGVRPDDLGAVAIRALLDRNTALDPARVGEVYFGAVPGSTLNRLCASGLDAVVTASRAIAVGDASIMIAGGVESMTRAPWVLPKPARGFLPGTPSCIPRRSAGGWSTPRCPRCGPSAWVREPNCSPRSTASPAKPPTRSRSAATSWLPGRGPMAPTTKPSCRWPEQTWLATRASATE